MYAWTPETDYNIVFWGSNDKVPPYDESVL